MLLHNDIGVCEDCADSLDKDDFKGCAVCELKKEIKRLKKEIRGMETFRQKIIEMMGELFEIKTKLDRII